MSRYIALSGACVLELGAAAGAVDAHFLTPLRLFCSGRWWACAGRRPRRSRWRRCVRSWRGAWPSRARLRTRGCPPRCRHSAASAACCPACLRRTPRPSAHLSRRRALLEDSRAFFPILFFHDALRLVCTHRRGRKPGRGSSTTAYGGHSALWPCPSHDRQGLPRPTTRGVRCRRCCQRTTWPAAPPVAQPPGVTGTTSAPASS